MLAKRKRNCDNYIEKNITFSQFEQDDGWNEEREREKESKREVALAEIHAECEDDEANAAECGKKHSAFSSREIYFMQTPRTLNKLK